jgi:hypothetical protein
MWRALVLLAIGGCSFDPGGLVGGLHDGAAPDTGTPAPDATVTSGFCTGDPDLVACYEFEGLANPAQPDDETAYGNDGAATSVAYAAGHHGTAMSFTDASSAIIPDSASLDVANITLEVWVKLDALPAATGSGRAGILDNNGEYGLFVASDGSVRCSLASTTDTGLRLEVKLWSHVACTYDGATIALYQDGVAGPTISTTNAMFTGGVDGMGLGQNVPTGDHLAGAIDDLRVWRVARSAAQIAADAAL